MTKMFTVDIGQVEKLDDLLPTMFWVRLSLPGRNRYYFWRGLGDIRELSQKDILTAIKRLALHIEELL